MRQQADPTYLPPSELQLSLRDVTRDTLVSEVAVQLSAPYMAPAEPVGWPRAGCVWGRNRRLFISLAVTLHERVPSRAVIFLVDFSAPHTYLARHCARHLLPLHLAHLAERRQSWRGIVNGKRHALNCSPTSFADVSVLGSDFLSEANLDLEVDWPHRYFVLS